MTRREALLIGAGALIAFGHSEVLLAAADDVRAEIMKFTGGKEPAGGKIVLDIPELVEDGSIVPLTVSVASERAREQEVAAILILAPRNPRLRIATFHFSPLSGKAEATTRIRLAETQSVIAVARMNDGSSFITERKVEVTVGGCRPS